MRTPCVLSSSITELRDLGLEVQPVANAAYASGTTVDGTFVLVDTAIGDERSTFEWAVQEALFPCVAAFQYRFRQEAVIEFVLRNVVDAPL